MTYYDTLQQNLGHSSQFGSSSATMGSVGIASRPTVRRRFGQAAYGQQHGQYGGQQPFAHLDKSRLGRTTDGIGSAAVGRPNSASCRNRM